MGLPEPTEKFAVIDIGSNSVRFVVYESLKRAPYVAFNEKVLCGLGRGLAKNGLMMEETMASALSTLKRFRVLLDKMDIQNFKVVATSAVREAKNGLDFVERVRAECGLEISVISGEEEAKLSAYGVLCALPRARGIVGDLGGGSLELAHVVDGDVKNKTSLAIGPLMFQDKDAKAVPKSTIDRALAQNGWLAELKDQNFYAVGGSWRALAKIHMAEHNYSLNNVHHYTISLEDALELSKRIAGKTVLELGKYRYCISARRIKVLSLSALVLHRVLKFLKPEKLIISGYGLREGLLFAEMSEEERAQDPLIAACYDLAAKNGRFSEHGKRLNKWIDPLFEDDGYEKSRLRLAVSLLCDVGWRGHPEYRAEKVLHEVLQSRLLGVTHRGAAFMGLALFVCYGGRLREKTTEKAETLVRPKDIDFAERVGLCLRLAQRISGGTEKGLKSASLEISGNQLLLHMAEQDQALANEVVLKRLGKLAKKFGLKEEIRIN